MTSFWFLLALIIPGIIGLLVVSLCWPSGKRTPSPSLFWLHCWLSLGFGLGVCSCTSFLTLLLSGKANRRVTLVLEILFILFISGLLWYKKKSFPFSFQKDDDTRNNLFSRILAIAFYTSLLLTISIFILRSLENPHGEPDAFYLWNSCARFLFRSGTFWKSTFAANTWSHPDYPLLLPANILRLWSVVDQETLVGPIILAFLFTFATIGILVSALSFLRGTSQGFLGGLLLSSTPYFIKHGASQYADVPLGFYLLATLVLITFCDEYFDKIPGIAVILGMSAGFAAWTKNEGLLFVLIVFFVYLLERGVFGRKKGGFKSTFIPFLAGVVPIMGVNAYFKTLIAPPNDLFSGQGLQHTLTRLMDLSRYIQTGRAFARQVIEPYSLEYSTPIVILFLYALLAGIKWKRLKKSGVLSSLFILVIMGISYFFVYIATPHDLSWHLGTSLSRLCLQLWPSTIFVALLIIAPPETRLSHSKQSPVS